MAPDYKSDKIGLVADHLAALLADSYTLMLKTQNYHWNVTGPQFKALHEMFEEQYTALFGVVDEVAERIRSLGYLAPASYEAFADLTKIQGEAGSPSADDMVRNLLKDHKAVTDTCYGVIKAAEEAGDEATADMAIARVQEHDKTAWMLNSFLEE